MGNLRLDEWLVKNGYYPSRARARDAILRGCISLSGEHSPKPSRTVHDNNSVEVKDPARSYVSRAALKLIHALEATGYDPAGKTALDIGASTGGFCQVLLERHATHVYGVDVGHGQLADVLKQDPRITSLEGLNAREMTLDDLDSNKPEFMTSDVSFISLKLALPQALMMAAENAAGIFLVKPQFEVGKDGLGKGGIVRDASLAQKAAKHIRDWLDEFPGWKVTHFLPSPILGGDGNQEFLLAGVKHG